MKEDARCLISHYSFPCALRHIVAGGLWRGNKFQRSQNQSLTARRSYDGLVLISPVSELLVRQGGAGSSAGTAPLQHTLFSHNWGRRFVGKTSHFFDVSAAHLCQDREFLWWECFIRTTQLWASNFLLSLPAHHSCPCFAHFSSGSA